MLIELAIRVAAVCAQLVPLDESNKQGAVKILATAPSGSTIQRYEIVAHPLDRKRSVQRFSNEVALPYGEYKLEIIAKGFRTERIPVTVDSPFANYSVRLKLDYESVNFKLRLSRAAHLEDCREVYVIPIRWGDAQRKVEIFKSDTLAVDIPFAGEYVVVLAAGSKTCAVRTVFIGAGNDPVLRFD